jgi:hypothetical protein
VGPVRIPWKTLVRAAKNFMVQLEQNRCGCSKKYQGIMIRLYQQVTVIAWTQELRCNGEHLGLPFLLHSFRSRLCTDPRDKVFAFLGLIPKPSKYDVIRADYNRGTREVLGDIFAQLLKLEDDLNLLVRQKEERRDPNLPTWMPDLTADVDSLHIDLHMYIMYHIRHFFNASYKEPRRPPGTPPYPCEISSGCLSAKGLRFDRIRVRVRG